METIDQEQIRKYLTAASLFDILDIPAHQYTDFYVDNPCIMGFEYNFMDILSMNIIMELMNNQIKKNLKQILDVNWECVNKKLGDFSYFFNDTIYISYRHIDYNFELNCKFTVSDITDRSNPVHQFTFNLQEVPTIVKSFTKLNLFR